MLFNALLENEKFECQTTYNPGSSEQQFYFVVVFIFSDSLGVSQYIILHGITERNVRRARCVARTLRTTRPISGTAPTRNNSNAYECVAPRHSLRQLESCSLARRPRGLFGSQTNSTVIVCGPCFVNSSNRIWTMLFVSGLRQSFSPRRAGIREHTRTLYAVSPRCTVLLFGVGARLCSAISSRRVCQSNDKLFTRFR